MNLSLLLSQLFNGLQTGSIYALVALGYSMVYGIILLLNFAHGDIIMVGAYAAFYAMTNFHLHPIVSVIIAVITSTLLGVVIEKVAYTPLRKAPRLSLLITAIGISFLLENGAQLLFGSDTKSMDSIVPGNISLGSVTISNAALLTIIVTIIAMAALTVVVQKTKLGKAMRAVSEDMGAAQLMGISLNRTISFTFAIGSALAGIGSVLYLCAYQQASPTMGSMLGLKAFVAAVLGGIGSIPGAMIGGFAIGSARFGSRSFHLEGRRCICDSDRRSAGQADRYSWPSADGKSVRKGRRTMKKTRSAIRIPMPLRYLINLVLILALWFVLYTLIQNGTITNYWSGILITVGINIILATSLNVATGYLGQLPLGHAGFMAVGAYAGGIFMKAVPVQELLKSGNTGAAIPYILLALLISAVVAGIFGILIGIPALRLRGDYLAIITLGFGEIIRVILTNIDSVIGKDFTYGAAGLKRIPKYSSFTLVFICVVVSCYIIHTFMKSRHGRAILSIREDEIASESVGVQTTYYKTFAFVVSAMLAGIAGCLYAGYIGSLYPSTFKFMKSIEILVMVVLGGMGSMLGSILSATVLTILPELLRSFSDYRMVVYSLALVVMMIFRPKGLLGSYDFSLSRSLETFLNRLIGRTENPKKEAADNE